MEKENSTRQNCEGEATDGREDMVKNKVEYLILIIIIGFWHTQGNTYLCQGLLNLKIMSSLHGASDSSIGDSFLILLLLLLHTALAPRSRFRLTNVYVCIHQLHME